MKTRTSLNLLILLPIIFLSACSSITAYQIDLLPAPDVYVKKLVNPFPSKDIIETGPYKGILYATDRLPSNNKHDEIYYRNERGQGLLRLGIGEVEIDRLVWTVKEEVAWDELVKISTQKFRKKTYPLQVKGLTEIGILDRSYNVFNELNSKITNPKAPAQKYAELINKKFKMSRKKDIYIYVHGYNTVFEDPLLVGSELWHYLGYDGVFIAYAWPATPRGFAYLADMDTAKVTSRNLRFLLEYLSEETDVENIHIIGYSMGTRIVTYTLADIALIHYGKPYKKIKKKIKIGNVILIGSDLELGVFGGYLLDGILNTTKSFTIYNSGTDSAMGASNWLFERPRLGEAWPEVDVPIILSKYLGKNKKLRFIDVTKAENAASGNGHHYFIESPWVSSDLLLTLNFDLTPQQRGLVLNKKTNMWYFSKDYPERVESELKKIDPKILNAKITK
ncbi:MAG: alpha/beta hydrolase [Gammaproteobacteria bacterium]